MITVTILHGLVYCLWYTADEGPQLGVIQHLQIPSALCAIKSCHILPEAASRRQVVSHTEGLVAGVLGGLGGGGEG